MLIGEAATTNFIVFGLTRPGPEPTIYCTQGEHMNPYTRYAIESHPNSGVVFSDEIDSLLAVSMSN
jgi:hypothetical protein